MTRAATRCDRGINMTHGLLAEAPRAPLPAWGARHALARLPERLEDRVTWKALHARQTRLLERWACSDFMKGLWVLGLHSDDFPDIARLGARLRAATSWQLVVLNGPIERREFFSHLARRMLPMRCTIMGGADTRGGNARAGLFHCLFGHAPMLMQPVFAEYLQRLGQAACSADVAATPLFWQHYERTAERGLIHTARGLRLYGATLLCGATSEVAGPAAHPGGFVTHDGDRISIDANTRVLTLHISDEEMAARKAAWVQPAPKFTKGMLGRYIRTVKSASEGCVTDEA